MRMSHWSFQTLLLICIFIAGCRQNSMDKRNDIPVVEVIQNLGKYHALPLSEFVSELEYIPLETNNNCLLAEGNIDLIVTSMHIFVRGEKYCYVFDRNGRFLSQIGSIGQGPGEYSHLTGFSVDEKKQSLYLKSFRTLLEYSWDGVFRQSINLPEDIHEDTPNDIFFVRDNLFIGHFRNHKGNLRHNFVLFAPSTGVIKLFDNYVQFNRSREMATWTERAMKPYKIREDVYVKELANDTLFCLSRQNELVPQFVFDIGEYTITKEKKESQVNIINGIYNEEIILPATDYLPMIGTQEHVFFSFRANTLSGKHSFPKDIDVPKNWDWHVVAGIYDAVNKTTRLLDTDPFTHMDGMINDLDGGLSFWPKYYSSDNELIDIWRAVDMKEYLTDAYFATHEIKDPKAHQKLKELLQKLDEEDNPVIVVGKYK